MAATKIEFREWRDLPLTQELLEEIAKQVQGMIEEMVNTATFDPNRIQYLKGIINGLSQVAGWEPEYIEEPEDETETP